MWSRNHCNCCSFFCKIEQFLCYDKRKVGTICSYFNLGQNYILSLGITGAIFALIDIKRILCKGNSLPRAMTRHRLSGLVVSQRTERDIKLITSVLTAQYFLLLAYGAVIDKAAFALPWMVVQTAMILVESVIYLFRVKCSCASLSYTSMFTAIFAVYNWMVVFCYLREFFVICD